ncbi:unnamed protein product, partial [Mesorhabditis spiculigera]
MGNEDIINFQDGKIVNRRWKILKRLGAGSCGAVYHVQDLDRPMVEGALKAERNNLEDGGVLKLEVEVLRKLSHRPHALQLMDASKRPNYSYMTMTLCDRDLMAIRQYLQQTYNTSFSTASILRIAVHGLYAIKQIHEVRYIHRDVKPGNLVTGRSGRARKMVYLIDYGMARSYVVPGGDALRKPRKHALLRGTLRYVSMNVHERKEQGRMDDLWALIYSLAHLYAGLPWAADREEAVIRKKKSSLTDDEVFKECPPEFTQFAKQLRTLRYEDIPDYHAFYQILVAGMNRVGTHFTDRYDWEPESQGSNQLETCIETSSREKETHKPLPQPDYDYQCFPNVRPEMFKNTDMKI